MRATQSSESARARSFFIVVVDGGGGDAGGHSDGGDDRCGRRSPAAGRPAMISVINA
jgi:hypothetical protein